MDIANFTLPPAALHETPEASQSSSQSSLNNMESSSSSSSLSLSDWNKHQQRRMLRLNRKRQSDLLHRHKPHPTLNQHSINIKELGLGSECLRMESLQILRKIYHKWQDCERYPDIQFRFEKMDGAMTNCMFMCYFDVSPTERILLRVYGEGTEDLFSRERELFILQVLSALRYGPRLLGEFENGRVEEYLDSRTLRPADMKRPANSRIIAKRLFELHSLIGLIPPVYYASDDVHNTNNSNKYYRTEVWDRMWEWWEKAREVEETLKLKFPEKWKRLEALIGASLQELEPFLIDLQQRCDSIDSPVVFGHNDLQYGNILELKRTGDLLLIDYEYSSYVNRGFDLANHFCEWAADYHSAKPHILHFDRLPSIEEQRVFLEAYLDAKESHIAVNSSLTRHRSRSSSSSASHLLLTSPPLEPQQQQQDKPLFTINNNKQLLLISPMLSPSLSPLLTPDAVSGLRQMELKSLFEEVNHFIPCSHVIWALWGLIQAGQSVIDFDYFEYSLQRFSEFFKWRSKLNWTTLT